MEVSFRPALTFPHTPARSPLAPKSSREPNPASLLLPPPPSRLPFSSRAATNPFGCTSSGPRVPIPCGSSERMFCHHTTLHAAPNSPSNRPGLLAPSACTPSPPLATSLPQGAAADTLATTYTPRISALGIPSASCARVRMRFIVDVKRASFRVYVRANVHDTERRQSAPVCARKRTLASACRFKGVSLIQG